MSHEFYGKLKTALLNWASRLPDIRAIVLTGSQARKIKPADAYADLDLEVFVSEHSVHSAKFIEWMRSYESTWMTVEEKWNEHTYNWLIMYRGAIKVDFTTIPVSDLQQLVDENTLWDSQKRGYEIWLDKDGLAAQLPPPKPFEPPPYTLPTSEVFTGLVEGYFYGAVYVAKQIKRGNLWKVKWADQIQQNMLLEMLEWHSHTSHLEPVDTYYRGDFMHDWVDEATWQELHSVFSHFDTEDSWRALLASVDLFTRLTVETGARLCYPYPTEMMVEVTSYVRSLQLKDKSS